MKTWELTAEGAESAEIFSHIALSEGVKKVPLIVTPAQAGVQENLERPGFPLSRE